MGLFSRLFPRYRPLTPELEARSAMEVQIDNLARRQSDLIDRIAADEEELAGVNEVLQALRTAVDACNPIHRRIERQITETLDANLILPLGDSGDENGAGNGNGDSEGGAQIPPFLRSPL